jgi:hypothetical protein
MSSVPLAVTRPASRTPTLAVSHRRAALLQADQIVIPGRADPDNLTFFQEHIEPHTR